MRAPETDRSCYYRAVLLAYVCFASSSVARVCRLERRQIAFVRACDNRAILAGYGCFRTSLLSHLANCTSSCLCTIILTRDLQIGFFCKSAREFYSVDKIIPVNSTKLPDFTVTPNNPLATCVYAAKIAHIPSHRIERNCVCIRIRVTLNSATVK